ncbi:hypothetical protein [Roseibium aggregatum]|uniref:Uncharacterized protein n=1 Tax=Roseibium aggregatum TaxID=187304 RepID=A0A939J484_9HYPH|nr:hypothetical protein [Roseibium aggregatum]MBN9670439.1 hypothetical protein [Roseibium aggregatum]
MPVGRRNPPLADFDRDGVLSALGEARSILVLARKSLRPRSGLSRSAEAVIAEIDEFALILTGARDYFHLKGHSTPARGGKGAG